MPFVRFLPMKKEFIGNFASKIQINPMKRQLIGKFSQILRNLPTKIRLIGNFLSVRSKPLLQFPLEL